MNGTKELRAAIVELLKRGGLDAVEEYGARRALRHRKPVVAVGIRTLEATGSGFGNYLGDRYDPESRQWRELYGKQLELSIALDVFTPGQYGEGGDCQELFEAAVACLERELPEELSVRSMSCGDLSYDRETDCYVCRGQLKCGAYYLAAEGESGTLLDFILKGVMNHGDNQS